MMFRTAQAYNALVLQNPRIVLAILLSVLVFFGYHAKDFKLDASADSLLLEQDVDLRLFREIQQRYPTNDLIVVTFTPEKDLFSDETLSVLKRLRGELGKVFSVDSVFTILDAPLFESSSKPFAELISNLPTLEKRGVDRIKAKSELLKSPVFRELLISADGKTTALLLNLVEEKRYYRLLQTRYRLRDKQRSGELSDDEKDILNRTNIEFGQALDALNEQRHLSVTHIREIIKPFTQYGDVRLGGTPLITDDMVTFVRNDLVVFGGGVLIVLVLVLALIFRELRWIALPLLSCFYAGLIMMGVLGFAGWKVTVISSNFLALMLIITISMNIHLIVRYRELQRDKPDDDLQNLVRAVTHKMAKPCLYTALTSIIGFSSLVVSGIKPVIDFGWMMSAGLAVTYVTCFLLFPSLLLALGSNPRKTVSGPYRLPFPDFLARLTEKFGKQIIAVSALLAVVSVAGILQLRVENSFINYFSDDTEIYQGLELIDRKLGGTTPLEILLRFEDTYALTPADLEGLSEEDIAMEREYAAERARSPRYWFTSDKVRRIAAVHDYLAGLPEIGKVLSLASTVRLAESAAKAQLDGTQLAILYTKLPGDVKEDLISPYVSIENNEARIFARVLDSNPDIRRNELLETVRRDLVTKLGLKQENVTVSGLLVLYNNMLQSLFESQIKTLGVVMLGIALMVMILFRSLRLALIAIVPNLISAALVLGFMGWINIPLDMMTITIAAITIGIAVDDDIHYIYRFREEYAVTGSYLKTMHYCHSSIGDAIFFTSLTVTVGFSVLLLSNFIPTIYFGLLTAAAMFIALFASLTLLPKLILWLKPFGAEGEGTGKLIEASTKLG
jgi:predicted RND superfamily exporter protein